MKKMNYLLILSFLFFNTNSGLTSQILEENESRNTFKPTLESIPEEEEEEEEESECREACISFINFLDNEGNIPPLEPIEDNVADKQYPVHTVAPAAS